MPASPRGERVERCNMNKNDRKLRRQKRVRLKIRGTEERPRLSVFRSNKFTYAQLINDEKAITLVGVSEKNLDKKVDSKKSERAKAIGTILAEKAKAQKIKKVVFDRGSYAYRGRISSVADGAREGGLEF